MVQPDVIVADDVVQPDVIVVDPVSSSTTNTKVMTPLTESFLPIDGGFPGGPIDRSVLIQYVDHV